jgi:hypothetical protein
LIDISSALPPRETLTDLLASVSEKLGAAKRPGDAPATRGSEDVASTRSKTPWDAPSTISPDMLFEDSKTYHYPLFLIFFLTRFVRFVLVVMMEVQNLEYM